VSTQPEAVGVPRCHVMWPRSMWQLALTLPLALASAGRIVAAAPRRLDVDAWAGKRVMFIIAHPDDVEGFAGGLAAELGARDVQVRTYGLEHSSSACQLPCRRSGRLPACLPGGWIALASALVQRLHDCNALVFPRVSLSAAATASLHFGTWLNRALFARRWQMAFLQVTTGNAGGKCYDNTTVPPLPPTAFTECSKEEIALIRRWESLHAAAFLNVSQVRSGCQL
jgi:hypothetical protein